MEWWEKIIEQVSIGIKWGIIISVIGIWVRILYNFLFEDAIDTKEKKDE